MPMKKREKRGTAEQRPTLFPAIAAVFPNEHRRRQSSLLHVCYCSGIVLPDPRAELCGALRVSKERVLAIAIGRKKKQTRDLAGLCNCI